MATTGAVDVNFTAIGNTINSGTKLIADATGGVATQGILIGEMLGLSIALGFIVVLLIAILAILPTMMNKLRNYRGLSK